MGAYLSTPVTEKETFEGEGSGLKFGGAAMQGGAVGERLATESVPSRAIEHRSCPPAPGISSCKHAMHAPRIGRSYAQWQDLHRAAYLRAQACSACVVPYAAGWRRTMEDAHLAQTAVANDPQCAIFGVFDGHGGAEVAKFCQRYMSAEIQKMEEFGQGNVEECLVRAFHKMVRAAACSQRGMCLCASWRRGACLSLLQALWCPPQCPDAAYLPCATHLGPRLRDLRGTALHCVGAYVTFTKPTI